MQNKSCYHLSTKYESIDTFHIYSIYDHLARWRELLSTSTRSFGKHLLCVLAQTKVLWKNRLLKVSVLERLTPWRRNLCTRINNTFYGLCRWQCGCAVIHTSVFTHFELLYLVLEYRYLLLVFPRYHARVPGSPHRFAFFFFFFIFVYYLGKLFSVPCRSPWWAQSDPSLNTDSNSVHV